MIGVTVGGLLALAIGGAVLVEGALRLAEGVGLSIGVIGATIVSLGTGAEMIALGISAARRKQADVLVGGIIGSFAYNLLVTLGVAALIRPLPVDTQLLRIALPVMILAHLIVLAFVWRGQITRWMGGVLLVVYAVYLILWYCQALRNGIGTPNPNPSPCTGEGSPMGLGVPFPRERGWG